jgi:uncharacterized protein
VPDPTDAIARRAALRFALGAIALGAAAAPVLAQDFAAAKRAYDEADYDRALQLLRPLAQRGDREAQFLLAEIHYFGHGSTEKNDAEAVKYYEQAARQGHVEAMFRLGYLYASGQGVEQSGARAAEWYVRAANGGKLEAAIALAEMYTDGLIVPGDERRARQWWTVAAVRGSAEGAFNLALNYMSTEKIPREHRRAYAWLIIAERRGSKNAAEFRRKSVAHFSPQEVKRGTAWAQEYFQTRRLPEGMRD